MRTTLPRASALLAAACIAAACGAKVRAARPVPVAPVPAASGAASSAPPALTLPDFEVLASKQARLAPGMRELVRGDATGPATLPAVTRDTCVRVTYAASSAVTAALVARDGDVLATNAAANEGVLEGRGPVCFHAESAPRLQFGQEAGAVRYVVWAAP